MECGRKTGSVRIGGVVTSFDLKTGVTTASTQPQATQTWVSDAKGWRVQNTDGVRVE